MQMCLVLLEEKCKFIKCKKNKKQRCTSNFLLKKCFDEIESAVIFMNRTRKMCNNSDMVVFRLFRP